MGRCWITAVILAFLLFPAAPGRTEKDPEFEPLFPVRLEHEFPNAAHTFDEARQLILNQYYTQGLTEEDLYWAAIQGMLRHISPPQNPGLAAIWTPEQYDVVRASLTGVQVSLGFKASFNPKEGSLLVNEVTPGSPAEDILLPLDRILRIGEKPLKGQSVSQVQNMLAGREGETAALTVNRDIKVFDVTLTHEKVEANNLIVTPLEGGTALVEIHRFTANLAGKLKSELENLERRGASRLIIDLRNNPGGVFMQALAVAELFLPEKAVALQTLQRDTQKTNYVSGNNSPFLFDIILLVNGSTASSAEILACALRDNGRAVIVGSRTQGKGVFETTFTLKNGCRMKFITGAMYTPLRHPWQGTGLIPDFLVEQDAKTLAALRKIPPRERAKKDVAIITAHKLLLR